MLKETPKRTAQELIATRLSETVCYIEDLMKATGEWQQMSPKEREQVQEQVKKVADRAIKACGYAETWQC